MIPTQARFLFIPPRNPYSHRSGILIHISPERLFTCSGIRTIGSENNIAAHASASEVTDKTCEQFTSEKELAQLAAGWPRVHQ